jgi:hypothetical protein
MLIRRMVGGLAISMCLLSASFAQQLTWNIDSAQSLIRMSIPDQDIDIGGGVTIFAGLRGAQPIFDVSPGATNPPVVAWSDDRGAAAPISGTLTTDYVEGVSIGFAFGTHNADLVETGQWIPNRDKWNAETQQFEFHKPEEEGAPAAFAAELTLGGLIRVGHVALYNIDLDADGVATLVEDVGTTSGGGTSWVQNGGTITMGGAAGSILDFWAQILAPSSRTVSGDSFGPNEGSLTIEDIGNNQRRMTIEIKIPFVLLVSGLPLQDSEFTGQIVATTTLPTPAIVEGALVSHGGFAGQGSPVDSGKSLAKEGLGPQELTYDNLINTSRGINGVVFDISNLGDAGLLSASDFEFQVSPQGAFDQVANPPTGWEVAPAPSAVTVTPGTPDRVLIEWPDLSITNRWLRITVLANSNTGLTSPEVYYIGHLLGESGPTGSIYTVAFGDISPIRSASGQTVDSSSTVDIDKSGTVSFADIGAMRANVGAQLTNITIP